MFGVKIRIFKVKESIYIGTLFEDIARIGALEGNVSKMFYAQLK